MSNPFQALEPTFGAGLRLLISEFQQHKMFTGTVSGRQIKNANASVSYSLISIELAGVVSRDKVERYVQNAILQSFSKMQIVALAFCGRGMDMVVILTAIGKDADWPDVTAARTAIQDIDHRAVVNYPHIKIWLPENAEVHRASGEYVCEVCNKEFYAHPQYRYPTDTNFAVKGCDGVYYHL